MPTPFACTSISQSHCRSGTIRKDGSITIFAQEYTVSYSAYLLEEASYHNFDFSYAWKLHVQHLQAHFPELSLESEPIGLSPYRSIYSFRANTTDTSPFC